MDNPYEPPQVAQCRGCSDSHCPHKPKEPRPPWWQLAIEFICICVGLGLLLVSIGYSAPMIDQAIRTYQGKP